MSRGFAALAVAVGLSLPVAASSQEQSGEPSAEARAAFDEGRTAFRLGHYDEAIRQFELAYRLSHARKLLYNIAQSYRRNFEVEGDVADLRRARELYRSYLREDPQSPERAEVEGMLGEIEERLAALPPEPRESPPEVHPSPVIAPVQVAEDGTRHPVVVTPTPPSREPSAPSRGGALGRWWFWTIAGAVVVGAAAVTVLAVSAEPDAPSAGLATVDFR
ncbi:MAG: tetratricopeptide repeat protein [Deltaproteobacteria bacterium]|nr:tetratricopeptide repeat protein [Deltaproteobacteria bacterium]